MSRAFTARHQCHIVFPTSDVPSPSSPQYHHPLSPQLRRPTPVTPTPHSCFCLCLCLCLYLLPTYRRLSRLKCTICGTFLTRRTPSPLDQPLRGTAVSHILVIITPVLSVCKTVISVTCPRLYGCLGWLGLKPNVLRWSLCAVWCDSLHCCTNRSCALFIK